MKNQFSLLIIFATLLAGANNTYACKNSENCLKLQGDYDDRYVSVNELVQDTNKLKKVEKIELDSVDVEEEELIQVPTLDEHFIGTPVEPSEPEFPGGWEGLEQYLDENINKELADSVLIDRKKTTVYVRFLIDEEGNVVNPEVVRGEFELLNNEALRVVGAMPKWKPSEMNGKKYKMRYTLPIHFYLN